MDGVGSEGNLHILSVYCNRLGRRRYTDAMAADEPELDYYRDVEDLFASLRGTPHVLSPRDFQLLRSWWRDGVPLAAVSAGLTEVFARQQERDDPDPVVSLSYCRHAVRRHAKRLAEMHAGGGAEDDDTNAVDVGAACRRLVDRVSAAAAPLRDREPMLAAVLDRTAKRIGQAGRELPAAIIDEHLFGLETTMLAECWEALSESRRRTIEARVAEAVDAAATDEARRRSARALRDREIRLTLSLPRLELAP